MMTVTTNADGSEETRQNDRPATLFNFKNQSRTDDERKMAAVDQSNRIKEEKRRAVDKPSGTVA